MVQSKIKRSIYVIALASLSATSSVRAAIDSTWNLTTGGLWNSSTNWTAGIPIAAGDTARLTNDIGVDSTVTIDNTVVVSNLFVGDSGSGTDSAFTLTTSGVGSLTLQGTGSNHAILTTIASASNVVNNIKLGSDLDITNPGGNQSRFRHR